jgi:hypothetical protein
MRLVLEVFQDCTLRKLYSSICSIFGRIEAEGEECFEDHLSSLEELQE